MTQFTKNDLFLRIPRKRKFLIAAGLLAGSDLFLAADVMSELNGPFLHVAFEGVAVVVLFFGSALCLREFLRLSASYGHVEAQLQVASGAFQQVIEAHFKQWGLTEAERDVALLSIKGLSLADMARLRESRVGTIQAHSAAIYRQAGVAGRLQLISFVVEDLIAGLEQA